MGTPKSDVPVPVAPLPNSGGAVVVPPVEDGFVVFPKMLPPLPNGLGVGVDGFAPKKLPGAVPGAGLVEVVPPPNIPPVAGVVVVVPDVDVVEVVPKSEPAGLEPKVFAGVVPVPVVPVPVVPVPGAGVVLCVVFVWPKSPEPPPKRLVPPPPPVPR